MEPRAHHILIGLFTLLVSTAAIVAAMWLSKADGQSDSRSYVVVFNEAVRGLSQGSPVQYSGITVGSVTDLTLDKEDPRKVLAHIRIRNSVPIRQDTQARLALAGISGASVIQLTGGSPDSPPLLGTDGEPAMIVARRSSISLLLANSDDLMAGVSRLVLSAQRVLSPENTRRFSEALRHVESLAATLANHKDDLGASLENMALITARVNALLEQTTRLINSVEGLLEGQVTQSFDSAQKAFASLQSGAASFDRILSDNEAALSSGLQGLRNFGPALEELRATMEAIKTFVRRLEDDPANYLLGREKMQEYTP